MKTTLYIFIDESGNETQDDYYVVAGCWCVSTNNNFTEVLDPTVQRLTDVAEDTLYDSNPISELKGASLPNEVIGAVVEGLDSIPYEDSTVPHTTLPWQIGYPVRFNVSTVHPQVGAEAIGGLVGDKLNVPKTMKLLMLISVLDPLLRDGIVDPRQFDDVQIILDADVWKAPGEYAQQAFDQLENRPYDVSFSTEDSVRTPGLQLADIAAYSWGRHLRESDCKEIVEMIDRFCFAEI